MIIIQMMRCKTWNKSQHQQGLFEFYVQICVRYMLLDNDFIMQNFKMADLLNDNQKKCISRTMKNNPITWILLKSLVDNAQTILDRESLGEPDQIPYVRVPAKTGHYEFQKIQNTKILYLVKTIRCKILESIFPGGRFPLWRRIFSPSTGEGRPCSLPCPMW